MGEYRNPEGLEVQEEAPLRIIIKYILKNLWEKKLRTLLILFSVMTACGLFFSSSAIGDTFAQLYINRINMYYGQTDIIIQPDDRSPSPWLKLEPLSKTWRIFGWLPAVLRAVPLIAAELMRRPI